MTDDDPSAAICEAALYRGLLACSYAVRPSAHLFSPVAPQLRALPVATPHTSCGSCHVPLLLVSLHRGAWAITLPASNAFRCRCTFACVHSACLSTRQPLARCCAAHRCRQTTLLPGTAFASCAMSWPLWPRTLPHFCCGIRPASAAACVAACFHCGISAAFHVFRSNSANSMGEVKPNQHARTNPKPQHAVTTRAQHARALTVAS